MTQLERRLVSSLKKLVADYPYKFSVCEDSRGKPCPRCRHILEAVKLIADAEMAKAPR